MKSLISLCIPCKNRTHDLKRVMPSLVRAAAFSPPVEVLILDYDSQDDLAQYMATVQSPSIAYRKYEHPTPYHMAHARNLSVLASHGEYFVISSTDISVAENFFATVRALIHTHQPTWLSPSRYKGVIVCKREEFLRIGGYDERIEFYGCDDREIEARLVRSGGKHVEYPWQLLQVIRTPNEEKIKNYRLSLSKAEMSRLTHVVLDDNNARGVVVANENGWGAWN